jgi:hypothetical protein
MVGWASAVGASSQCREPGGCSFLVTERFPDTAYTIHSLNAAGDVVATLVARAERADGSMSAHFTVNGQRLLYCHDVQEVVDYLTRLHRQGDLPASLPAIDMAKAVAPPRLY